MSFLVKNIPGCAAGLVEEYPNTTEMPNDQNARKEKVPLHPLEKKRLFS
jgi:hypothetical protein